MPGTALPLLSPDAPARGRAAAAPTHLADLELAGRRELVVAHGHKAYRADQVSRHYFGRLVRDPVSMTDIPGADRDRLVAAVLPPLLTPVRELHCDGGTTRKSLWRLHDGSLVESVLMGYRRAPGASQRSLRISREREERGTSPAIASNRGTERTVGARKSAGWDRVTVCVSSQAGCGMGCPFCATGQGGLRRNLSTAEIVDQVVWFAGVAASGVMPGVPARLSHVVFMGMGEPLANYARVVAAVRRLVAPPPEGLGLSARHLTVSTVGLVPAMRRLAEENLPVTLALSLHAPDDDLRDELVPINERWKVAEVLQAAWNYAARSGRRVSVEYALIRDVNDQPWRADLLGRLLAGKLAHVNLIPLNPTPGSRWDASEKAVEREFARRLRAAGVATTVRDTRGREIDGACGQLAASEPVGVTREDGASTSPRKGERDSESQVAKTRKLVQDPVGITGNLVQSGWADSRGPGGKAKR